MHLQNPRVLASRLGEQRQRRPSSSSSSSDSDAYTASQAWLADWIQAGFGGAAAKQQQQQHKYGGYSEDSEDDDDDDDDGAEFLESANGGGLPAAALMLAGPAGPLLVMAARVLAALPIKPREACFHICTNII
jgi:hypothetical protein